MRPLRILGLVLALLPVATAAGIALAPGEARAKTFIVFATAGAGGTITPSGPVEVERGTNQTFTITPSSGYLIADVRVDGVSIGPVSGYTFINVVINHTIAATFTVAHTLTVNVIGNGSVLKNPNQPSYPAGSTVQLTAVPGSGFAFTAWSGDASGGANPLNLVMSANRTVTATFRDNLPPSVTVLAPNGGESVALGTSLNLQWFATDNVGVTTVDLILYRFGPGGPHETLASGIANSGSYPWTVTGPTSTSVVLRVVAHDAAGNAGLDASNAVFTLRDWLIVATAGAGGTITPSGAVSVVEGGDQGFAITAAPGRFIGDVLVDDSSVGPVSSYTFNGVTSDHTIAVTFGTIYHALTADVVGNGTVMRNPELPAYPEWSTVQLTAVPDPGYAFTGWSGDLSGSANPVDLVMDTDKAVTAEFAPLSLEATATTFPAYNPGSLPPAWADYDGDGDLDLPLYRNNGNGTFSEIPGFRPLLSDGNYHGASWCDYDRDGDVDLVLLPYNGVEELASAAGLPGPAAASLATEPAHARVLRNQGNGSFVDVAPSLGMDVLGFGETAVWGDFDGDGWPDLYTPYYAHVAPFRSYLYHNNGDGTFTDVATTAGVDLAGQPQALKPEGAQAADYDDDGDLDIYCASHLFVNDGNGMFTDVRAQVGLPLAFDEGSMFVDYDNDGDLDLYLKLATGPTLYRNDAGSFTDVSTAAGLTDVGFGWGDSWADVDNDGDLDLYLVLPSFQPAHLMLNQGDGTFVRDPTFNVLDSSGLNAWADDDRDGDLDLHVEANNRHRLENVTDRRPGFAGSFVRVLVVDGSGRRTQHGATVRLRRVDGPPGVIQTRVVDSGSGYLTQSEYVVHFGVVPNGVYALSVSFPSHPASRVVVDETQVAWLGSIVPATLGGQVVTVYRSGGANPWDWVVAATAGDNGTVRPSGAPPQEPDEIVIGPSNYPASQGSSLTFMITPAPGYHVADVTVDGISVGPVTSYTFDNITANHTIVATFAVTYHSLTADVVGSGSVTKDPDLTSYPGLSTVVLTAVPDPGFVFVAWSGDATGNANPLNLVMDADKSVTASFTEAGSPGAAALALAGTSGVRALSSAAPRALTLGPVEPNPMRDVARIGFGLPAAARVRLQILDLQGREVAALADDVLPAGGYTMTWDGRRDGRRMPTGMYFVRLQAEGRDLVRRLVLTH